MSVGYKKAEKNNFRTYYIQLKIVGPLDILFHD